MPREVISLSFLTYLRHSLVGFKKNLMANKLGRKWEVKLPGREKGILGRRWRKVLLPGDMGRDRYGHGPGRYGCPRGQMGLAGWVNLGELVDSLLS